MTLELQLRNFSPLQFLTLDVSLILQSDTNKTISRNSVNMVKRVKRSLAMVCMIKKKSLLKMIHHPCNISFFTFSHAKKQDFQNGTQK